MIINNITIEVPPGILGLSLSGGADSALLAYILMKTTTNPIHFFTVASKIKHRATIYSSVNVINKCIELTNNTNIFHHITYVEEQKRETFFQFLENQVDTKIVDIMYTATTNSPSKSVLDSFSSKLENDILKRRDPSTIKNVYSHSRKIYHPFVNIDKKDIKQLYEQLEILDSIFPLTRSCESVNLSNGHCGKCWWCEERFWAFSRLS
jgi:7-cyano-7-deazaguanine synthase in queuosine biosynthesis